MLVSVVFLAKLRKYFSLPRIRKFKSLIDFKNNDVIKVSNRRGIDMESNEKNIDSYKSHEKIM